MQPITHSFTVAHLNKYTGVLAVSAHAGEPAVKIVTYNSIKFKVKKKKKHGASQRFTRFRYSSIRHLKNRVSYRKAYMPSDGYTVRVTSFPFLTYFY